MLLKLVDIQYERNDIEFERGKFRVRGDVRRALAGVRGVRLPDRVLGRRDRAAVDHRPAHRRDVIEQHEELYIYPAKHFVMPEERIAAAVEAIKQELEERLKQLQGAGQAAGSPAAQRPDAVRHRDDAGGRLLPGHRELQPAALAAASRARRPTRCSTSFPNDYLLIVDESHVTVPQIRAMFAGDHSRKTTLVEHGFRLPSALDNRPLQVRRVGAEDQPGASSSRPRRATMSWSRPAAKSSSR